MAVPTARGRPSPRIHLEAPLILIPSQESPDGSHAVPSVSGLRHTSSSTTSFQTLGMAAIPTAALSSTELGISLAPPSTAVITSMVPCRDRFRDQESAPSIGSQEVTFANVSQANVAWPNPVFTFSRQGLSIESGDRSGRGSRRSCSMVHRSRSACSISFSSSAPNWDGFSLLN